VPLMYSLSLTYSVPADLHKKSPNQLGRWAAGQLLGSDQLVADLPSALEYPGPGPAGVNGGYTLYDASARRLTHCSQLVSASVKRTDGFVECVITPNFEVLTFEFFSSFS